MICLFKKNVFIGQTRCVPTTKQNNCFNASRVSAFANQIAWWRNANSFSRAQLAIQVIFAVTALSIYELCTQKRYKAQKNWKIFPSGVKTLHTHLDPLRDGVVIGINGVFVMRSCSDNLGCCVERFWKFDCLNGTENKKGWTRQSDKWKTTQWVRWWCAMLQMKSILPIVYIFLR